MNYKIGDVVVVLDDIIKGKVIRIDTSKIDIETEDGFIMQFNDYELVKIYLEQSEISKTVVVPHHLSIKTEYKKKKKLTKMKSKKEGIPPMEVDLHIDKLIKSKKGMDNFDVLSLQLDTAKYKLEFAIRNRIPRIIFIHGVGEGVLREELKYLFNRYNVKITEASYQKYGLGATEVYVLQNSKN